MRRQTAEGSKQECGAVSRDGRLVCCRAKGHTGQHGNERVMTNGIRKRFCVRCGRRVDLDKDIGAVELTDGLVMCGADVDKLIAEICPATGQIESLTEVDNEE